MPKIKLQNKVNGCMRGISILEILVAVGLILLICVPTIQIVYSLQSKYISDIVQNEPISISQKYSKPNFQSILAETYHGDGSIRTVFKRGGMREVDIVAQDRIFNRNNEIQLFDHINAMLDGKFDSQPPTSDLLKNDYEVLKKIIKRGGICNA